MNKTINTTQILSESLATGDAFLGHNTSSNKDVRIFPNHIDEYIAGLNHYYTTDSIVLNAHTSSTLQGTNSAYFQDQYDSLKYLTKSIPNFYWVGGTNQNFETLAKSIKFLSIPGNMTGNVSLRLTANEIINEPLVIDLPYNLGISAGTYNIVSLYPSGKMERLPLLQVKSNLVMSQITLDGSLNLGFKDEENYDGIIVGNGAYLEFKDGLIHTFNIGIRATGSCNIWLMGNWISNCHVAGTCISASNVTYRAVATDYYNNTIGIDIITGSNLTVTCQAVNCLCYNESQFFISKSFENTSFDKLSFIGNSWNNVGRFHGGFDFTSEKQADTFMTANAGQSDKNPFFKYTIISNTTASNTGVQNVWVTASMPELSDSIYYAKWKMQKNKTTYLTTNTRSVIMYISGQVYHDVNQAKTYQLAVAKNGNTASLYGLASVTADLNSRPFNFSTIAYIPDVHKNDYFQLYIRCTTTTPPNVILSSLACYCQTK